MPLVSYNFCIDTSCGIGHIPDVLTQTQLIDVRSWLGLSQEKLAQLLGVSFASVNRWERGHSGPTGPTLEVYRALDVAKRKGVTAQKVLGDEPTTPGQTYQRIFNLAYGGGR